VVLGPYQRLAEPRAARIAAHAMSSARERRLINYTSGQSSRAAYETTTPP
jgi:hypothetical protein